MFIDGSEKSNQFHILILCSMTLLYSLISSRRYFGVFYIESDVICGKTLVYFFLFNLYTLLSSLPFSPPLPSPPPSLPSSLSLFPPPLSYFCLTTRARTSNTMFNSSSEIYPQSWGWETSSVSSLGRMLAVVIFMWMCFIILRNFFYV